MATRRPNERRAEIVPRMAPTPSADMRVLKWDYSRMDTGLRRQVQEAAFDICDREQRAAHDLIAIGRRLRAVKQLVPHGQFEDWIQIEFGYSPRMAQELMNVARRFGDKSELNSLVSASALRLLAAPSVPDAAVAAVLDATHREDRPLLVREVKDILAAHKPRPRSSRTSAGSHTNPPTIEAAYTVRTLLEVVAVALPRTLAEKLHAALQTRDLRAFTGGELAELDQLFSGALAQQQPKAS